MAKVIAVANQKGGCSKTSVVANLGIGLAMEGKKVAVIDADPQGSLTASLGYQEPDDIRYTLATIMMNIINEEEIDPMEGILHHGNVFGSSICFPAENCVHARYWKSSTLHSLRCHTI